MNPKVEFYQDDKGEWRWRLKGGNNEIVADSGEGYTREADAVRGFANTVDLAADAYDIWKSETDR